MRQEKFYCRAYHQGKQFWEFLRAPSKELARECFIQNYSLPDTDTITVIPTGEVDKLSIARLLYFIPKDFDPWGCSEPFTLDMVWNLTSNERRTYDNGEVSNDQLGQRKLDPRWHAARIQWMMLNPKALLDPISVDCHCNYGVVYPIPEITDGWHRFFAHRALGKRKIPAFFCGRTDLLDYLALRTNNLPEE